jgi:ankyrin repeat protein
MQGFSAGKAPGEGLAACVETPSGRPLPTARQLRAVLVTMALVAGCTDHDALLRLEEAIRNGNAGSARQLLAAGASVNATLSEGWTPLTLAASLGNLEVVEVMVDAGADLEQARRVGIERQWTPLGWAARRGHRDVVEWLLERGARVDALNSRHQSPLMAAALGGHHDVMALLVEAGADESARDAAGRTARELVP